jgi:hypothetical protein
LRHEPSLRRKEKRGSGLSERAATTTEVEPGESRSRSRIGVASGERTRVVDFLSSDLKSFFAELENRRFEGGVAETDDAAVHRSLEKVKAKNDFFE